MSAIILISIFLPMISSLTLYLLKDKQRWILNSISILTCLFLFILSIIICFTKDQSITLIKITKDLHITFSADITSKFFSILFALVFLIVSIFSIKYLSNDDRENKFHSFYILSLAMLICLSYAKNLVTMYLSFEMITFVSMPLVMHARSTKSIRAALKYLYYSIGGAFLGLVGILIIYNFTSNGAEFIQGGALDIIKAGEHNQVLLVGIFCALVGFSIKAGMFPFNGWLPTAHPVAPSPASAILSGIITKAGVLVVIRVIYYCVGCDILFGTWVQYTFIILALLSILLGSSVALIHTNFKTRLAYSSISQLSYILLALSMLNETALLGAYIHIAAHAFIKVGLFLCAGSIQLYTRQKDIMNFEGIGKQVPITMVCYTLLSLGLVGIPPFGAFTSKWFMAVGSINSGLTAINILAPAVLLISAILTAAYLIPISIKGFIVKDKTLHYEKIVESYITIIPLILLTIFAILVGIFSNEIINIIQGIM